MEQQFFNLAFFQSVASNLIAVLLGAALGVPAGMWLDRRSRREGKAAEAEREAQLKVTAEAQVLEAIRKAVIHNRELLRQVKEKLSFGSGYDVIFFNVDPRSIDVLMPALVDRCRRFDIIDRVNNFRYQLEHAARKIDTQYDLVYGAGVKDEQQNKRRRDEIIRSLLTHAVELETDADRIDAFIADAVKALGVAKRDATQPSPNR